MLRGKPKERNRQKKKTQDTKKKKKKVMLKKLFSQKDNQMKMIQHSFLFRHLKG